MIIGIGETVLDILFKNEQPVKAVPGGSAFNAIISIGRTGTPCTMATEVGDDHVGEIVVNFLRDNGVNTDYVFKHEGTKTHVSLAFLDENNDAQYQFYKDHASLTMHKNLPDVKAGDIVIFGSFFAINPNLRDYVYAFLTKAKEVGAILYYDINFRAAHLKDLPMVRHSIMENIALSTVVRGSAEDFQILFGEEEAQAVYDKHIKDLCPCFIYTNAAKPIELFTPTLHSFFPAKQIETISTIGAGDNFNAGFCYAMHRDGLRTPDTLKDLTEDSWAPLIAQGQEFSSEVCQSLDNYIAPRNS